MDKQEFSTRVIACEKKLFRIAYLTLGGYAHCEDAVQEALLKAWADLASLRNPALFDTWLIRILINECHNILRQGGFDRKSGKGGRYLATDRNFNHRLRVNALDQSFNTPGRTYQ